MPVTVLPDSPDVPTLSLQLLTPQLKIVKAAIFFRYYSGASGRTIGVDLNINCEFVVI
jgi:hypothetical protein